MSTQTCREWEAGAVDLNMYGDRIDPDATYALEQAYLLSKEGDRSGGEDRLILGPRFYGVADGSTAKSGENWGTEGDPKTGGAVIADIIKTVLEDPAAEADPERIVGEINSRIQHAARAAGVDIADPRNRSDAAFTAYSTAANAIYHIHDCPFAFLDKEGTLTMHYREKIIDVILSTWRAQVSNTMMGEGLDPFGDGSDRAAIIRYLERQGELHNESPDNPEPWPEEEPIGTKGELAYRTMNGSPTTLDTMAVPEGTRKIIMSSDGFRILKPTTGETLAVLREQLAQDPHCIARLRSTKGLKPGNVSYDDMAYLGLKRKTG